MTRPLRIEYEGAWYHVMNRGAERRAVFTNDKQRQYFLSLLAAATERFNAEWHAYCLMGNHYHLLIRTPDGNLQRIMRHVNGVYTQYYNRTQGRDGALFRGRYKAILVDAQAYWMQLSRYIHRNPLEVGRVKRLASYPWSSYRAYIGLDKCPDWLRCDAVLNAIARRNAKVRYRAYVEAGVDDDIASFYAGARQSPILGDDAFKRTLGINRRAIDLPELNHARLRPTADQIVSAVARRFAVDAKSIWALKRARHASNPARAMAMYLCQRQGAMRLADIANRFGLKHYASAGASIRQFQKRLNDNRKLRRLVNAIKLDLTPCVTCVTPRKEHRMVNSPAERRVRGSGGSKSPCLPLYCSHRLFSEF